VIRTAPRATSPPAGPRPARHRARYPRKGPT
jgi:hypothetical protein